MNLLSQHAARGGDVVSVRSLKLSPRILIALSPIITLSVVAAIVGMSDLCARLVNDDQSYYIIVARNLFVRGPTYDGAFLTNGVHVLQTIILGLVFRISDSWHLLAPLSVIVSTLCGCLFLYVIHSIRRTSATTMTSNALLMSSLAVFPILYRGMEGGIALLVVALFLKSAGSTKHSTTRLALLSVALWAARLELVALPPIVAVLAGEYPGLPQRARRPILIGWLTSLGCLGAYLLANYLWIGMPLPVSGVIKQTQWSALPLFIIIGALSAIASSISYFKYRRAGSGEAGPGWMTQSLLIFMSVFFLSHSFGQSDTQVQTWYYFSLPLTLAVALVESDRSQKAMIHRAAFVALLVVAVTSFVWEVMYVIPLRSNAYMETQQIVNRAKTHAKPGDRFMGPGSTALLVKPEYEPFSLDGIVGGVEQYRAIKQGRLLEFAYENGVRFVFSEDGVDGSGFTTSVVSSGNIQTGRSIWNILRGVDTCGGRPCERPFTVFRLSRKHPETLPQ